MPSSWMVPVDSASGDRCSSQRLSGEPGPRDASREEKVMGRQGGTRVRWDKTEMARSNVKNHQIWQRREVDYLLEPMAGTQPSKHIAFWTKKALVATASGC